MLARLRRLIERPMRSAVGRNERYLHALMTPSVPGTHRPRHAALDSVLGSLPELMGSKPPDIPQHVLGADLTETQLLAEAKRVVELRFELAAEPEVKFADRIDWRFDPTSDPRRRWCRDLHRHRWVALLTQAYCCTNDELYAQRLVELLTDWIHHNPPPKRMNEADPVWTLMGVGMRAALWPAAFYNLLRSPAFDRAAQTLMLASVHDHGEFLFRFRTHANHLLRETNGLLALAGYFPVFAASSAWRERALQRFAREAENQVYPDGSHQEMSTGYQWLVAEEFEAAEQLLRRFGWSLPGVDLRTVLDQMYNVLLHTIRPDGSWPQLGDGFLEPPQKLRRRLAAAGVSLNRPDLLFAATLGREGERPSAGAKLFPQGAFTVMRSNWSERADWLLFRAGPFGGAHGHEDKLSIEVSAGGEPMLVDPGTYTYNARDPYRTYFVSSNAHNTVIVDGKSQVRRWDTEHREPSGHTGEQMFAANGDGYSYACASYQQGYGHYRFQVPEQPIIDYGVTHHREVLWITGAYWLILDYLNADSAHRYSRVFQSAPGLDVTQLVNGAQLTSAQRNAGLLLLTPDNDAVSVEISHGESPERCNGGGWASNGLRAHKCAASRITLHADDACDALLLTLLLPQSAPGHQDLPAFRRQALSDGTGVCVRLDFDEYTDCLLLSRNTEPKHHGELSTSARIAAWRSSDRGKDWQPMFEIDGHQRMADIS